MNLEKKYKVTMVGLSKYMIEKDDPQITALLKCKTSKALFSIPKEAKKYLLEEGTQADLQAIQPITTTQKDRAERQIQETLQRTDEGIMVSKPMHGNLPTLLERVHWHRTVIPIDEIQWAKGETVELIIAVQDQALNTRYCSKHITKQGSIDKCHICHSQPETVVHKIP